MGMRSSMLTSSSSAPPPSSVVSPLLGIESRASSVPRLCASSTDVFASSESTNEFWERFKSPLLRRKTALQRLSSLGSLGNISLPGSSREVNFPSGRQMRHQERRGSVEPLVTIKCQRMNSDRRREEVDIAVPLAVYRNLESGGAPGTGSGQSKARTSWQHLRRLVRV